jgi:hypothetical protein
MSPDVQPPILERYGFTWVQHSDGLYYGPPYPGADDTLAFLEGEGALGHRSVARGDYRYFLRYPEVEEPRSDRFGWDEDAAEGMTLRKPDGTIIPLDEDEDEEDEE